MQHRIPRADLDDDVLDVDVVHRLDVLRTPFEQHVDFHMVVGGRLAHRLDELGLGQRLPQAQREGVPGLTRVAVQVVTEDTRLLGLLDLSTGARRPPLIVW
jgi:hypothetical protein